MENTASAASAASAASDENLVHQLAAKLTIEQKSSRTQAQKLKEKIAIVATQCLTCQRLFEDRTALWKHIKKYRHFTQAKVIREYRAQLMADVSSRLGIEITSPNHMDELIKERKTTDLESKSWRIFNSQLAYLEKFGSTKRCTDVQADVIHSTK